MFSEDLASNKISVSVSEDKSEITIMRKRFDQNSGEEIDPTVSLYSKETLIENKKNIENEVSVLNNNLQDVIDMIAELEK